MNYPVFMRPTFSFARTACIGVSGLLGFILGSALAPENRTIEYVTLMLPVSMALLSGTLATYLPQGMKKAPR